jgi:hypothetical protein
LIFSRTSISLKRPFPILSTQNFQSKTKLSYIFERYPPAPFNTTQFCASVHTQISLLIAHEFCIHCTNQGICSDTLSLHHQSITVHIFSPNNSTSPPSDAPEAPSKTNEDKLIDFGSSDLAITSEQTSTNLNNNFIDSNSSLITHNLNNNNNLVAASENNDDRGEFAPQQVTSRY